MEIVRGDKIAVPLRDINRNDLRGTAIVAARDKVDKSPVPEILPADSTAHITAYRQK